MAVAAGGPGRPGAGQPTDGVAVPLSASARHLANTITLARLAAALPVVLLIQSQSWQLAFVVFLAASLSDLVDGWVAKRFAGESSLGAVLDPMADKLLVAGAVLALAKGGELPVWFALLVVVRDLLIVLGTLALRSRASEFRIVPLAVGKLATLAQLLTVAVVLADLAGIAPVGPAVALLVPLTTVLLLASGLAYLMGAVRTSGPGGVRA